MALRITTGGKTRIVHRGDTSYIAGPPELVIEIASGTESIDLHRKRHDYEQNDVGEYLAVLARTRAVIWFVREDGRFVELAPDADGVLRSRQFPGLWLDPAARRHGAGDGGAERRPGVARTRRVCRVARRDVAPAVTASAKGSDRVGT